MKSRNILAENKLKTSKLLDHIFSFYILNHKILILQKVFSVARKIICARKQF